MIAGDELELIRPSIYRNVARQLNISLHSESVVTDAFLAVAAQIFAAGISLCIQPRKPTMPVWPGVGPGPGLGPGLGLGLCCSLGEDESGACQQLAQNLTWFLLDISWGCSDLKS